MSLLYITADRVGEQSGGGQVTENEYLALRQLSADLCLRRRDPWLGDVTLLGRDQLACQGEEPWKWDGAAMHRVTGAAATACLAHFYAGTFAKTVEHLKRAGVPVAYTIAAHDRAVSRQEHEALGVPFSFPHLIQEDLWRRYIEGYRLADVIVCPSTVAADTVRRYGGDFETKRIEVIPHGCTIPEEIKPPPRPFTVGYLGVAGGADKGVRYLLEAWKQLDYRDGSLLTIAGRDSTSPWVRHLVEKYGGGAIHLAGWQSSVSDFYNGITLYVQPSATEGFGCEVLEAMAHGRPALCSTGAGAQDVVPAPFRVPARDAETLADRIDMEKDWWQRHGHDAAFFQDQARPHTWDRVRARYRKLWEEML